MCSASLIFLLAFITQASQAHNAQDIMNTLVHNWVDRTVDKLLVDRMINKLFDPEMPNPERFIKQVEDKPAIKAPFVQSRFGGSGTSSMVRGISSSIGGTSSMVRGTSSMIGGTSSIVKGKSSVIGGTSSIIHGTSSVIGGTSSIIHGTSSIIGGTTSQIRNWKYSSGENQEDKSSEPQREYTTPGGYKVPENLKILPKDSDQDKQRKRKAINAIKWQQRVNRKKEALETQVNSWNEEKKRIGLDKRPQLETGKPQQANPAALKDDGVQGMRLRRELPFLNPNNNMARGSETESESSDSNDMR